MQLPSVCRLQFAVNVMLNLSIGAALFASAPPPVASSGTALQPNSSNTFPRTLSSVLSSAQRSPDFLATVVQVVKAAFAAEQASIVHSNVVAFSSQDDCVAS